MSRPRTSQKIAMLLTLTLLMTAMVSPIDAESLRTKQVTSDPAETTLTTKTDETTSTIHKDAMARRATAITGWYHPVSTDPQPVPISSPTPKYKKRYLTLAFDTFFYSAALNNAGLSGASEAMMLRFGGMAGISIGFIVPGPHLYLSFDLLRRAGIRIKDFGGMALYILLPTLSMEMVLISGFSKFSLGAGASATGVRFTLCKPIGLVFDLRGPTTHLFTSLGKKRAKGLIAGGLGFSLDMGIIF